MKKDFNEGYFGGRGATVKSLLPAFICALLSLNRETVVAAKLLFNNSLLRLCFEQKFTILKQSSVLVSRNIYTSEQKQCSKLVT